MTEAPVSPGTSWPRPTTTKGGRAVTTTLTAYHLEAADWLALAQLDDDGAPRPEMSRWLGRRQALTLRRSGARVLPRR